MALVKLINENKRPVCVITLEGHELHARGEKEGRKDYGVFDLNNHQIEAVQSHGLKVVPA